MSQSSKPGGIDSPIALEMAMIEAMQEEMNGILRQVATELDPFRDERGCLPGAVPFDARQARLEAADIRANYLGDECGRLRDENRELLAENARLRRQLERKR